MERVACIDVGTVTARLAVADLEGGVVRRLAKSSTICNLGEGLAASGRILSAARRRVSACVDGYLRAARSAGAAHVCCTLTAAARDASNADELLGVLRGRGLDPEVIPGEIEGLLTFLGVAQDLPGERLLVADSGGGSTELALGRLDEVEGLDVERVCSTSVGCRRMTERFLLREDPPAPQDVAAARAHATRIFTKALNEGDYLRTRPQRLVATGGTATSLVAVKERLVPYDATRVHLASLTVRDLEALLDQLAGLSVARRAELPGLQPQRASVIVAGAVALAALMETTGFDELTVSESDLLFGLAICAGRAQEGRETPVGWTPSLTRL